jgi:serine protease DegQ
VIDESGHMLGMVVGTAGGHAVLSPSWILGPIASELSALGEVSQGWMGINGTTLHDATHPARTTGVHVLAVAPRSAAAKAGLAPGDDITAIDANTVTSIAALQGRLYTERPGTVVDVGLIRRGTHETIRVTLAGAQS